MKTPTFDAGNGKAKNYFTFRYEPSRFSCDITSQTTKTALRNCFENLAVFWVYANLYNLNIQGHLRQILRLDMVL